MQALSNRILASGIMIIVLAGYSDTGSAEMFKKELTARTTVSNDTTRIGSLNPQGGGLCYQDIISRLFEKKGELFSSKWNSRDKVGQMISAICNASADGLNPKWYEAS